MGVLGKIKDDEADDLVWALFGLRVSICESEGSMRAALQRKEHELVEALADVIDPHAHVDLPAMGTRGPSPSIF